MRFRKKPENANRKEVMTMGADLYLDSEYKPNRQKWEPLFNHWAAIRDDLLDNGKIEEANEAQRKVDRYFDKMLSNGHFRDSYNDTNLIWKFGLCWWVDMDAFLAKGGIMTPEKSKEMLKTLAGLEGTFEANVRGDKNRRYFESKYKRFKKFLKKAIEKNEPIACSI
jgi:hypothetical protein